MQLLMLNVVPTHAFLYLHLTTFSTLETELTVANEMRNLIICEHVPNCLKTFQTFCLQVSIRNACFILLSFSLLYRHVDRHLVTPQKCKNLTMKLMSALNNVNFTMSPRSTLFYHPHVKTLSLHNLSSISLPP